MKMYVWLSDEFLEALFLFQQRKIQSNAVNVIENKTASKFKVFAETCWYEYAIYYKHIFLDTFCIEDKCQPWDMSALLSSILFSHYPDMYNTSNLSKLH